MWRARHGKVRVAVVMSRYRLTWLIFTDHGYIKTKSGGPRLFKNSKQAKAFCEERLKP